MKNFETIMIAIGIIMVIIWLAVGFFISKAYKKLDTNSKSTKNKEK